MEVVFSPELQAKLEKSAIETGRSVGELLQHILLSYFDELGAREERLRAKSAAWCAENR